MITPKKFIEAYLALKPDTTVYEKLKVFREPTPAQANQPPKEQ